jgi:hypothetical protein
MREEGLPRRQFTFATTPAQVLVQLIGRSAELVVAREIYRGEEREGALPTISMLMIAPKASFGMSVPTMIV